MPPARLQLLVAPRPAPFPLSSVILLSEEGLALLDLFALTGTELWLGIVVALALMAGLLIPYLLVEIRTKADLGPGIPVGTGDTHPGYVGNPTPGQPELQSGPHDLDETFSLRSFHILLVSLSVVLAAGTSVWGLYNHRLLIWAVALGSAILMAAHVARFVRKAKNIRQG